MNKLLVIIYLILLNGGVLSAQNAALPLVSTSNLKWDNQYRWPNLNGRPVPQPGNGVSTAPDWGGVAFPPGGRLSTYYIYQATFKNDGQKKIKGLIWEYIFSDISNKEKLKSHRFFSTQKIGVKKSVTIRETSPAAPTPVVSAGSLKKDGRSPYLESVEIKCIVYKDNSTWMSADTDSQQYDFLLLLIKRRQRFH